MWGGGALIVSTAQGRTVHLTTGAHTQHTPPQALGALCPADAAHCDAHRNTLHAGQHNFSERGGGGGLILVRLGLCRAPPNWRHRHGISPK